MPPMVQRLFLKMQKYDLRLEFSPGKELLVADTLSRSNDMADAMHDHRETVHANIVKRSFPLSRNVEENGPRHC